MHHVPDGLLVVLSCWLSLSLLIRAPRDPGTRVFAWFALLLALYGLSSLLPQMTSSQTTAQALNRLQLCATVLAPPGFLHFILVLTSPVNIARLKSVLIGVFYSTGIALALYALFGTLPDPAQPPPGWSRWGEPRFPDSLVWVWTAQRVLPMLVTLAVIFLNYRTPPRDAQEARLRHIFSVTGMVAVGGALAAAVVRDLPISPLLPRAVMVGALLALAYAVLFHRALLPARVARRTFFYSILGSFTATLYVGLVLILEHLVRVWLQINLPIVSAFAVVILVATLDPIREWTRSLMDRHFYRREFDYVRLVRSLGDEVLEQGNLTDQLQVALSMICRALGVRSGLVIVATPTGLAVQATYGEIQPEPLIHLVTVPDESQSFYRENAWTPWPAARLLLPLRQGEDRLGLLVLGSQHLPESFSDAEYALLDYVQSYLAMTISHTHARELQQDVIAALAEQSRVLREQQEQLAEQAALAMHQEFSRQEHSTASSQGLHIYALGPLRVERNAEPITRWGGDKAGTYQAEALFAFLFDRRGKGVTKDEVAEVIWPDLDIDRADSAFHRTLAALRRTLEPGLRRGNLSQSILYHHERYWLQPAYIAWCDTETFMTMAEHGMSRWQKGDLDQALLDLEAAHALYRGDYMDDCPFFGDSVYVEEQRRDLRVCYQDVQLALGAIYELQGRAGEAISAYRRALALSATGSPVATQALERLQVTV